MCEPTTDELVRLAADGDTEAFADLIPRFHDRLCARVYDWTWGLTAEDREDVLQHVWVDVWEAFLHSGTRPGSPLGCGRWHQRRRGARPSGFGVGALPARQRPRATTTPSRRYQTPTQWTH